jgi:hypothetical protein
MIDEVLTWAQSALGRVYLADGGLMGADVAELPLPQNHGVRTVAELVEWYTAGAQGAAPSQQRNPASA